MPLNSKEKEALKFLGLHLFYGLAAAATFGAMVLATDLSHIRTLALDSAHPVLILALMFCGLFVTFGGLGMAAGIMSLAQDDERELE
jgi:hypothetical protein